MELVGRSVGSIRVLELIGEGGMGEVYVGFDETLQRSVALKAIHATRRLDQAARGRFLREARLLSRLDHPNICRIHGYQELEETDLLVLEWIRGRTLTEAMAAGLTAAQKMHVADGIAAALVVAHQAGVVHRDIKPGNVMLTDEGEVKVLDFGLARLEGALAAPEPAVEGEGEERFPEPEPPTRAGASLATLTSSGESPDGVMTRLGQVVGSPNYMSPEQARGEAVTPASDLYSFGLLLQKLFTGKPLYEEGAGYRELLERAGRGETRPVEGLDRDLTALIQRLKSLAPTDRPTALDTAQWLHRIQDKPRRRLRRFAAATAILLVALAGLKYTVDLRRERTAAVAARQEAEQRRSQAEDLIDFMIGDLRGRLEPLGRLDLLAAVGNKATDYFQSIDTSDLDAADLHRRSTSLRQIGEVWIAQGDLEGATTVLLEALALSEGLVARDPANETWLAGLGASRFYVGHVYFIRGDLDAALEHFKGYLKDAEILVERSPDNPEWRLELAYAHSNIGSVLEAKGAGEDALAAFTKTADLKRALASAEPDVPRWLEELASTLSWLGTTHERRGALLEALARYREGQETLERLVRLDRNNGRWLYLHAISRNRVGIALLATGSMLPAREQFSLCVDETKGLVARDPTNLEWRRELATAHSNLARVQLARGELDAALDGATESVRLFDALLLENAEFIDWEIERAGSEALVAEALRRLGRLDEAGTHARSAVDGALQAQARAPDSLRARKRLAEAVLIEGRVLADAGASGAAADRWKEVGTVLAAGAGGQEDSWMLAIAAEALARLGRRAEAEEVVQRLQAAGFAEPAAVSSWKDLGLGDGITNAAARGTGEAR